jgi:hypothetical protein
MTLMSETVAIDRPSPIPLTRNPRAAQISTSPRKRGDVNGRGISA